MKTLHVGGLSVINRHKTLESALKKAQDDDIIMLHKTINESVTIDKAIIIDGNNNKFKVNKSTLGIKTTANVVIKNIRFIVEPRANAIVAENNLTLKNIKVKLVGPIREFYPIIYCDNKKTIIENCELTKFTSEENTNVLIKNTVFKNYYGNNLHLDNNAEFSRISGNANIENSSLSHIKINNADIIDSQIGPYVHLNNYNLENIDIVQKELQANVKLNKEPDETMDNISDDKYCLFLEGKGTLSNYSINLENDEFLGIYGNNTSLEVNDSISKTEFEIRLNGGDVKFIDSVDSNFWNLNKTKFAKIRSKINTNIEEESALEKLNKLVGQKNVKNKIQSIMNTIQMNTKTADSNFEFSNHMIFAGEPGVGKAEWVENRIITPDGEKRFGDLKVGDCVFDENGELTRVLNIFPQGKLPAYKLTTIHGKSGIYSSEHLWSVTKNCENKNTIITLGEMMDNLNANTGTQYGLPITKPLQFAEKVLLIDPYTMGISITNNFNEFMPKEYLEGSIEQRYSLLQGLMDNNGNITKTIGTSGTLDYSLTYTTVSSKLKEDFIWLVRSLGYEATVTINRSEHQGKYYNINILAKNSEKHKFFRTPEKLKLSNEARKQNDYYCNTTNIDKITPLNTNLEMMCIQVENPSHLYISSDMLVTHNTTIAKIVGEALFEIGALPENKFTEATVDSLIKGYVGQTAENTRQILDNALGGVLFIDEAYQLTVKDGQNTFNDEAISVIIRYMEEHRNDLVVIAAGYSKEMKEFLASNPGLSRRFQWVEFEDYSKEEMSEIFELMRKSAKVEYDDPRLPVLLPVLFEKVIKLNLQTPDVKGRTTNGGNGGLVRNVYQKIITQRNNRVMNTGSNNHNITKEDIVNGFKEEIAGINNRKL